MSLFTAIESSFRTRQLTGALDRALGDWRANHDAFAHFAELDELIACLDDYRDPESAPERDIDEVLAALCTEACRQRAEGGAPESRALEVVEGLQVVHSDEAASLILWLFLPQLWGSQYANPGRALDRDDLEAEMALGLWEAVVKVTATTAGVGPRLVHAARRRARATARDALEYQRRCQSLASIAGRATSSLVGHPLEVVRDALRAGVINRDEARLIAKTRIEGWSLADVAASLGVTTEAALLRRKRAETRLVAWLGDRPVPVRRDANGRERYFEALRQETKDVGVVIGSKPTSIEAWGGRKEVIPSLPPIATPAPLVRQRTGSEGQRK